MKFNKLFLYVIILLMASFVWADYIISDSNNTDTTVNSFVRRLASDGTTVIWAQGQFSSTVALHRGAKNIEISPVNGGIYVGYNNIELLVNRLGDRTGHRVARAVTAGHTANDLQWGYDYNADGVSDFWTIDSNSIRVYDGSKLNFYPNMGIGVLARFYVADTNTVSQDGTGGNGLLFGPDKNSDGVADIYITKGGTGANDPNGNINVWDPVGLKNSLGVSARIAVIDANQARGLGSIVLGPDDTLWVVSQYNDRILSYDPATSEYVGIVSFLDSSSNSICIQNPMDIDYGPSGTILIATRFACYPVDAQANSDTAIETTGGDVLQYDPSTGVTSLVVESTQRINGVAYADSLGDASVPTGKYDVAISNYYDNTYHWLARYNPEPYKVWENATTDGRGGPRMAVCPIDGNIYVGYTGTDQIIMEFTAGTGVAADSNSGRRDPLSWTGVTTPTSKHYNEIEWGPDYNADGVADLYCATRTANIVLSGDTRHKRMTPLAVYEYGTSITDPCGAGGWGMCMGPDINGDGVKEMYCARGTENSATTTKFINVWNGMDISSKIAAYNITGVQTTRGMIMGPDFNNDGYQDLYIATDHGGYIAVCSVPEYGTSKTFQYLGAVCLGIDTIKSNPMDIGVGDDGSLFIASLFATGVSASYLPNSEVSRGNIIRYYQGVSTLFYEPAVSPVSRFRSVAVMPATYGICKGYPDADFNLDCAVNFLDFTVLADEWFACTDPVTENCN